MRRNQTKQKLSCHRHHESFAVIAITIDSGQKPELLELALQLSHQPGLPYSLEILILISVHDNQPHSLHIPPQLIIIILLLICSKEADVGFPKSVFKILACVDEEPDKNSDWVEVI